MKDTYSVLCWINIGEMLQPGDEITTTTSTFSFNCISGTFDRDAIVPVEVIAEHINADYSDYVRGKHNDGGCYGYDNWKVIEVVE